MQEKLSIKLKTLYTKRRNLIFSGIVVVVLLLVFIFAQLASPKPSVAAYCKVYENEKTRLVKLPGDTWPSAVFNDSVGNANEFAISFARLEKVAPDDIKPDITTLQKLYKKVSDDPSQAFSASLSGIGPEDNAHTWTENHCTNKQ